MVQPPEKWQHRWRYFLTWPATEFGNIVVNRYSYGLTKQTTSTVHQQQHFEEGGYSELAQLGPTQLQLFHVIKMMTYFFLAPMSNPKKKVLNTI